MAAKQTHQKPRLGRGLSSLVVNTAPPAEDAGTYVSADAPVSTDNKPHELLVERIGPNPYQPRKTFDKTQLAELAESIRQQGVLQPLLVAPVPEGRSGELSGNQTHILIAGQRRLRAAQEAGLTSVPVVIRKASDEQILEWAIIENIQRSDLNPVERAQAFRDVIDRFSLTQAELAERMGTSRESVANYLRILDLCDDVQKLLLDGKLSFGHARALAGLSGKSDKQRRLAKRAVNKQLSVRQLEALVAAAQAGAETSAPRRADPKAPHLTDLEQQLARQLSTRVVIKPGRKQHTGRLTIDYNSLDDFDRLLTKLGVSLES